MAHFSQVRIKLLQGTLTRLTEILPKLLHEGILKNELFPNLDIKTTVYTQVRTVNYSITLHTNFYIPPASLEYIHSVFLTQLKKKKCKNH